MKLLLSILVFACLSAAFALAAAPLQPETPAQPPAPAGSPEDKPVPDTTAEYVKLTTTTGDIYLELNKDKAPVSTANFLSYTDKGHYDGTIFHRVMPGFMIQGGGFDKDMNQKPTDKGIKNEWQNGLKNVRGSVAMARIGGRPESATSQFFINVVDNPSLDRAQPDGAGYAVFGRVVSGMDVVDKIKAVRTTRKGGHADVPVEPVVITKAERISAEDVPSSSAGM